MAVPFHRRGSGGERCLGGAAVTGRPDREHCVGSRVLCWPSQSRANEAAGELLLARGSSRWKQEPEPWRIHDYPSSSVHQHIFSVHCNDMCWLFTVSICGHWYTLSSTIYIYNIICALYSNIDLQKDQNNGIRVQECIVFIVIFFSPVEAFLSHLSSSPDILAFCLSWLHTSSVCRFK